MTSIEEEIAKLEQEPEIEVKTSATVKPLWYRILFADASKTPVEDFRRHPLNYDNKDSTGRIVKGLEGMMGNLDKAVLDLLVGIVQKANEGLEGLRAKQGD